MQLAESQVNLTSLIEIFNSAFMDVSNFNNESFQVKFEDVRILITINPNQPFIKFNFLTMMKNIDINKATKIINKMNHKYLMVKFVTMEHEDGLIYNTQYYMSFKKGLIKHQLVDNLKLFEKITIDSGLRELEEYFV